MILSNLSLLPVNFLALPIELKIDDHSFFLLPIFSMARIKIMSLKNLEKSLKTALKATSSKSNTRKKIPVGVGCRDDSRRSSHEVSA